MKFYNEEKDEYIWEGKTATNLLLIGMGIVATILTLKTTLGG